MERIKLNSFDSSYDLTEGVTVPESTGDCIELREDGLYYVDALSGYEDMQNVMNEYKEIMPEYFEHTKSDNKLTKQQAIKLVEVTTGRENDILLLKECN